MLYKEKRNKGNTIYEERGMWKTAKTLTVEINLKECSETSAANAPSSLHDTVPDVPSIYMTKKSRVNVFSNKPW